jgi:hypothetical protein
MRLNRNLPPWERALRVIAGTALAAAGFIHFDPPLGWGIAASGIILLATGLAGFCPACAVAGRRDDVHD